jgi:acetolactate synthase-1/2/3 large subunit
MTRTAAHALVETLAAHGVDRVFCVPGESYLPVLDALRDEGGIEVVTCRHEGGAGMMAVVDAKLTGRPGVCLVSRGPGTANASLALHTAQQDAVPLVLLVGQVERPNLGRGAFQEVEYRRALADFAKHAEQVEDPERVPEALARAFFMAGEGTPGAVVLALPEDMLEDACAAPAARPRPVPRAAPAAAEVEETARLAAAARAPVLVVGGQADGPAGRAALLRAAERLRLPVATTFKHQDLFPNRHPCFAGHLGYGIPAALRSALAEADLLIAVGTRLGDVASQGYALPRPGQDLVHVYPDARHLGAVFAPRLAVVSDAARFLDALADAPTPAPAPGRDQWIARLHATYADLAEWRPRAAPDGVDFGVVVRALEARLPADAVLVTDAGNFSSWLHRHYPFTPANRLVGAVGGAMGMGVPGAVAAALREPGRAVVALVGDGGFLMTGMELATAVRHGARIRVFVSNNGSYGTIRLHQARRYPGRPVATSLTNPDFAALARAFGAKGLTVAEPGEAEDAVAEALAHPGPVVVDVRASLRHISAYAELEEAP